MHFAGEYGMIKADLQKELYGMKKPNLVYILADDMGWGDVSCLNPHSAFQTPNFDRLGAEGAIFTDAHATSALCTPSRYGILTGRYNWRSRLKSGALGGYSSHLIEPGRLTVAQMLQEQGYATGCIGKWHLGMDWTLRDDCSEEERSDFLFSAEHVDFSVPVKNGPVDCGFDSFFGISASLDIPPYVYLENDHPTALPDHEYPGTDGLLLARRGACAPDFRHEEVLPLLTKKARAFITDHREEPFFLYFPMPSPHTPVLPAPEFVGKSHTNAYGDYCLMCDDVVGQILEQLRLEGLEENTIVIYTSDNGCAPFVNLPELLACGHNPSAWFRGYKSDIFEGGHRIPLLVRWPEKIRPGTRVDDTVCLCDLMATMAEILGISLPENAAEDSISNLPLWLGHSGPVREYTVHHSGDGSLSIRKGNWKLEMCPGSGGWSFPENGTPDVAGLPEMQLYNLEKDPGETHNLWEEEPELAASMKALLFDCVINGRSTPGTPQPNNGADVWETVRWMAEFKNQGVSEN